MLALDRALSILPTAALAVAAAELGVSAYLVSISSQTVRYGYYNENLQYTYRTYNLSPPGQLCFLLFCSLWTILVTAVWIALPFIAAKKPNLNKAAVAVGLFVLTHVTMIFWLAGFGSIAPFYMGWYATGSFGALLAFAIIAWLIFLGLAILNWLTAFGVLKSERFGHHAMFRKGQEPQFQQPLPQHYQQQPQYSQQPQYPQQPQYSTDPELAMTQNITKAQ